jgi:hypothetical protein
MLQNFRAFAGRHELLAADPACESCCAVLAVTSVSDCRGTEERGGGGGAPGVTVREAVATAGVVGLKTSIAGEEALAGGVYEKDGGGGIVQVVVEGGVGRALNIVCVQFVQDVGDVAVDRHVVPAGGQRSEGGGC